MARCTVVDADAAGALMYSCVSSVCSKTCTGYDDKQLSNVQREQQRAENRALWHAERQQHDNRRTTSVEDLLCAPVEKRHYPGECCSTYAERPLQTTNQNLMVGAVERHTQV